MNFEINKESFKNTDFDPCNYINNFLQTEKNISELDVLTFKLKILQREFSNEMDLSVNNLVKLTGNVDNDLKTFSNNLELLNKRYYDIRKSNDIDSNDLDKLHKASALKKVNSNLKYCLERK